MECGEKISIFHECIARVEMLISDCGKMANKTFSNDILTTFVNSIDVSDCCLFSVYLQ